MECQIHVEFYKKIQLYSEDIYVMDDEIVMEEKINKKYLKDVEENKLMEGPKNFQKVDNSENTERLRTFTAWRTEGT